MQPASAAQVIIDHREVPLVGLIERVIQCGSKGAPGDVLHIRSDSGPPRIKDKRSTNYATHTSKAVNIRKKNAKMHRQGDLRHRGTQYTEDEVAMPTQRQYCDEDFGVLDCHNVSERPWRACQDV